MLSQAIAAGPPLASATMEKYHSIIHTPSMPFANYQLNQERHLLLLQSQLDGHKLRADDFEKVSESLAAEMESVKERHSAAGHRQFQVPVLYDCMHNSQLRIHCHHCIAYCCAMYQTQLCSLVAVIN